MSKKDYELIAATIRTERELFDGNEAAEIGIERIAYGRTDLFYENNDRFDRDKFLIACGIQEVAGVA